MRWTQTLTLLPLLSLLACKDDPNESGLGVGELSTGRVIEDGTPEALGVLELRNAAATTLDVLDVDVGLDKRAATNLLAHRNGADGVAGTADDDDYRTIESVTFTKDEAAAVVDVANTATQAALDEDIGLDSRAAAGIVAGRPPTTVERVAVRAPATTVTTSANVRDAIASVYVQRDGTRALASRSVDHSSMSWMFDRYTVEQPWWDDTYRADQARWQKVRDVLTHQLSDVTVWSLGRRNSSGHLVGDIDVFAIGVSTNGDLVGVWTVVVET